MASDRSGPGYSIKDAEMRDCKREFEERLDELKRVDARDLAAGIWVEGDRKCNIGSSGKLLDHKIMECGSKMSVATTSVRADRLATESAGCRSFDHGDACLTIGHSSSINSSSSLGLISTSVSAKQICSLTNSSSLPINSNKEHDKCKLNSLGLGVDLIATDTSTIVEKNPFYPFKKLGQVKSVDDSECGSTTGPVKKERDSLRIWKEMKQNGFLSSSHGGIPMPKQRCRHPKKKKEVEPKKKVENLKREQSSRFTKIAAPSGLLSGLNPGIINHVRNSKQVYSIIEAIVRSETPDDQTQTRVRSQIFRGNKDTRERWKEQNCTHDSTISQFNSSVSSETLFPSVDDSGAISGIEIVRHNSHQGASTSSQPSTNHEDDVLAPKLSAATTLISENASSTSTDELSPNQENINSVTVKAATVASQWLELLQLDIKGRLAALRRSRKRVRNVIQTELPYLFATEFMSSQENDPSFLHPSEACSRRAISEKHVAHWKSLFAEMDKALYEEGKHLESWLKQVQEMQSHCQYGFKFVGLDCLPQTVSSDISRKLRKCETLDQEFAVRAAAASLYSTCNMIMTTENPPYI